MTAPCPHGSRNGVRVHKKRGEYPCEACLFATSDSMRANRIRSNAHRNALVSAELLGRLLRAADPQTAALAAKEIGPLTISACKQVAALADLNRGAA